MDLLVVVSMHSELTYKRKDILLHILSLQIMRGRKTKNKAVMNQCGMVKHYELEQAKD
jgi:hypothetical protein